MPRHLLSKQESIRSFARFCDGLEQPRSPLEVFLEISNVCDLKCAMCTEFSAINPHRFAFLKRHERGFLRADDVATRMTEALEGALLVHCSGYGEPTVNPDFRDFISYVSSFETLIGFITNGMHLTPELAEFLVESKVFRVMVSLSGTERSEYESIYLRGDYERVLGGIRALARAKAERGATYPLIEINSLGFRQHVDRFDRFVAMMAEAGANVVHLKKLQPYVHIPELYEHVSVMRPWIEGKTLARAAEIGRSAGVQVSVEQYVADGVADEAEYERRMAELRASAERHLSRRGFGQSPISEFAQIARETEPERSSGERSVEDVVPLDAAPETARARLDIAPLDAAHGFHCMEPFKTLYVRQNGTVKPCCFGNDSPWLGSIRTDDGLDVWRGAGFTAIRDGIIQGDYPHRFCGRCVRERIGPPDHFVQDLVDAFLAWYTACHSPELELRLQELEPRLVARLRSTPGARVAANHRARPSAVAAESAALEERSLVGASVEGWLEQVAANRAVGWAWLPDHPDHRPLVELYQGRERIAHGVACRPRGDLVAAGKGDGCYEFNIALPPREPGWTKGEMRAALRLAGGEIPLPS